MKKLIILITIIALNLTIRAQSYEQHQIGLGVASSFLGFNTNMWVDGDLIKKATASPVPQFSYTYMLEEKIGVGFAGTYQLFYFDLFPIDSQSSAVIMKIHRYNATIHAKYYFVNQQRFDLYASGRIGATYWHGNISFSQLNNYLARIAPPFISESLIKRVVPSDLVFRKPFFAYQLNLGVDIYFTKNIGLKLETGLGAPYWALTGLNVRF